MVLIRQAAPGTVTRNRTLAMDRFEALEIPLPPVEQQRQVAAELERVAEAHSRTSERLQRARVVAAALADSQESQLLERLSRQGVPLRPLGRLPTLAPVRHGCPATRRWRSFRWRLLVRNSVKS